MSSATFYKWRAKFGEMDASMMIRLKELEDENLRLKKMYAEEKLKAETIQEAMARKVVKPFQHKEMAQEAVAQRGASIRLVCQLFGISEGRYRYQAKFSGDNLRIVHRPLGLTQSQGNWG